MFRPILAFSLTILAGLSAPSPAAAQEAASPRPFAAGDPLGVRTESGFTPISDNVKVFGSFRFAESCTFDPARNLILAMNMGNRRNEIPEDGYVSLIRPDGSVHTSKWIGATRDGLELDDPLGSAIRNGFLYAADVNRIRKFDLASGAPVASFEVSEATGLNGIAVAPDGTIYASNTGGTQRVYRITPEGDGSVFVEGAPLNSPNGVAIDPDGNVVVVNIGDASVLTFSPAGRLVRTESAAQPGNDGLIILDDGTKYVSSVRQGGVSRIRPGAPAELIAWGIPNAASMCYDSVQHQLVIPMNPNNALAFIPLER